MIVDFFGWQERALGWLLAWGTGNVIVGMGGARAADEVVRQIARQAVGWGSVDLLLAINGRCSARRHARTAGPAQVTAAVTRFRRILAINAVLDVFYVLGGSGSSDLQVYARAATVLGWGSCCRAPFWVATTCSCCAAPRAGLVAVTPGRDEGCELHLVAANRTSTTGWGESGVSYGKRPAIDGAQVGRFHW